MIKTFFIVLLLSTHVFGQINTANVIGYVYDAKNGEAIPFCEISLKGSELKTQTNLDGYFKIDSIPVGEYILNLFCLGYNRLDTTIHVQENDKLQLKFYLNCKLSLKTHFW